MKIIDELIELMERFDQEDDKALAEVCPDLRGKVVIVNKDSWEEIPDRIRRAIRRLAFEVYPSKVVEERGVLYLVRPHLSLENTEMPERVVKKAREELLGCLWDQMMGRGRG